MKPGHCVFLFLLTCTALSAARKFPLAADPSVPAARGDVEVGHDKNGNTKFKIKVEHLAEPDSLTPPKTAYVVWLQERGGNAEPQGQLRVDKKLNASFAGVTPAKNFDILITAEPEASPKVPSGIAVLKATIQP